MRWDNIRFNAKLPLTGSNSNLTRFKRIEWSARDAHFHWLLDDTEVEKKYREEYLMGFFFQMTTCLLFIQVLKKIEVIKMDYLHFFKKKNCLSSNR